MVPGELARGLEEKVLYRKRGLLGQSWHWFSHFGLILASHLNLPGLKDAMSEWAKLRNKSQKAWV